MAPKKKNQKKKEAVEPTTAKPKLTNVSIPPTPSSESGPPSVRATQDERATSQDLKSLPASPTGWKTPPTSPATPVDDALTMNALLRLDQSPTQMQTPPPETEPTPADVSQVLVNTQIATPIATPTAPSAHSLPSDTLPDAPPADILSDQPPDDANTLVEQTITPEDLILERQGDQTPTDTSVKAPQSAGLHDADRTITSVDDLIDTQTDPPGEEPDVLTTDPQTDPPVEATEVLPTVTQVDLLGDAQTELASGASASGEAPLELSADLPLGSLADQPQEAHATTPNNAEDIAASAPADPLSDKILDILTTPPGDINSDARGDPLVDTGIDPPIGESEDEPTHLLVTMVPPTQTPDDQAGNAVELASVEPPTDAPVDQGTDAQSANSEDLPDAPAGPLLASLPAGLNNGQDCTSSSSEDAQVDRVANLLESQPADVSGNEPTETHTKTPEGQHSNTSELTTAGLLSNAPETQATVQPTESPGGLPDLPADPPADSLTGPANGTEDMAADAPVDPPTDTPSTPSEDIQVNKPAEPPEDQHMDTLEDAPVELPTNAELSTDHLVDIPPVYLPAYQSDPPADSQEVAQPVDSPEDLLPPDTPVKPLRDLSTVPPENKLVDAPAPALMFMPPTPPPTITPPISAHDIVSGSQDILAMAGLFASMKKTLLAMTGVFERMGSQTEKMVDCSLDIQAVEQLKQLRINLNEQIERQKAEVDELRNNLESKIKAAVKQKIQSDLGEIVRASLRETIGQKVQEELSKQIPEDLRQKVISHQRQIMEVKTTLHNSEARRYNALQTTSNARLRPLLRPLPTPEQSPVALTITRSNSLGNSALVTPSSAFPRVPAPTPIKRTTSGPFRGPPTASARFPPDLHSLFSLGPDEARRLLSDYGLVSASSTPAVERPPRDRGLPSVDEEANSGSDTENTNGDENPEAYAADMNKFMAHIGVPFLMVPAPKEKEDMAAPMSSKTRRRKMLTPLIIK